MNDSTPKPNTAPRALLASNAVGKLLAALIALLHSMNARFPWLRRVLGVIVLIGGLVFVVRALRGQLADLAAAAIAIPTWHYPVLTALATLTVLITATLHAVIIAGTTPAQIDFARVRYAYAASQIARYVPGKVFGVLLEAQMLAPSITIRQVITATLVQTLLVYAWAGIASIIILGALAIQSAWPVLLAVPALGALWFAQRDRWLERLGVALTSRLDRPTSISLPTSQTRRSAWRSTLLLAMEWIPFLAMWFLLAGPSDGLGAAFWLGASYLLASIAGSLFVFIPSGLVVREAAFVWLGELYGLPAPTLMAWAVVLRIALTLADVAAVPLLWADVRTRVRRGVRP